MDKRKLAAVPRKPAAKDMLEIAERLGCMSHIVTAEKIFDNKILLLCFYELQIASQFAYRPAVLAHS